MLLNSSAWELHEQKGWLSAPRGEWVLGRRSCACARTWSIFKMLCHVRHLKKTQTNSKHERQLQACAGWNGMQVFMAIKLSNVQTIKYSELHSKRKCPSCYREGLMWKAFHPHPLGGFISFPVETHRCVISNICFTVEGSFYTHLLFLMTTDFKLKYRGKYFYK